jgi:uncharacterized DUF497 family protein
MNFEWDDNKAASNLKKHKVSFDEASTVFKDPLAAIFADDEHSAPEELREIIIGISDRKRLLLTSFTEREATVIRIISSRPATKHEQSDYEKNIWRRSF